jgi:hypothetical protein
MVGERLSIAHEADPSAEPYVYGTVAVARWICQMAGLVHGLDRLLFGDG